MWVCGCLGVWVAAGSSVFGQGLRAVCSVVSAGNSDRCCAGAGAGVAHCTQGLTCPFCRQTHTAVWSALRVGCPWYPSNFLRPPANERQGMCAPVPVLCLFSCDHNCVRAACMLCALARHASLASQLKYTQTKTAPPLQLVVCGPIGRSSVPSVRQAGRVPAWVAVWFFCGISGWLLRGNNNVGIDGPAVTPTQIQTWITSMVKAFQKREGLESNEHESTAAASAQLLHAPGLLLPQHASRSAQ